jgi:small-conductance mechanosensitive channel
VLSFGIAIILNLYFVLHANIAALLTTSALLTAVLGFALQATLGNLFEGLSIQVHQPFSIGDWLESNGEFGRIHSLTWRAITLQQPDHTIASIPNNVLAQSAIRVIPNHHPLRVSIAFPAPINMPPQRVIKAVEEAVMDTQGVLRFQRPEILLQNFDMAQAASHYELRFYTLMDEDFGRVQSHVRTRVWYALARAGIPLSAAALGDASALPSWIHPQQAARLSETVASRFLAANPQLADFPEPT